MSKFYYDTDDLGYDIENVGAGLHVCSLKVQRTSLPLQGDSFFDHSSQKQISYSCDPRVIGGPTRNPNGPDTYTVDVNGDTVAASGTSAASGTADDVTGVLVRAGDNHYVMYQRNGVSSLVQVPPPAGAPAGTPVVSPQETQLQGDLTRVFGGGDEGQRMARAYIDNPPAGMTRETWIRSQHEQFHPSGGGNPTNPPSEDVLKNRLSRNLEYNLQQRYQSSGAASDRARTTVESFRVSGDREATLQNLLAERERFATLDHGREVATQARPNGVGMTSDQWTRFARSHGYMGPEGLPSRELNRQSMDAALAAERNAGNNEDRLRAYVRGVYPNTPNTDEGRANENAFMESLPSDPARRREVVSQHLGNFESSPGVAKTSGQPNATDLSRQTTESLERRARSSLTALGYDSTRANTAWRAAATPAQQRVLVQRAEALQDAQERFVSRGGTVENFRRMIGPSDPAHPNEQRMNWTDASGNIRSDLDPAEVRRGNDRMQAIDEMRAMFERQGYSREDTAIMMRNMRIPPSTSRGDRLSSADPALIRAANSSLERMTPEQRNQMMLSLAQNNLVNDYAAKMHVSEDAARLHLADRGFLRQSQTLQAVDAESQRIDGLDATPVARRATPTEAQRLHQQEVRSLEQSTGATRAHPQGTQARMDQLRQRINPADRQYADQIATLDRQHGQQWELRRREVEMTGRQNLELADRNHQNAIAQQDHKAVLDERLVGIQHENAMELERMRIKAQMVSAMLQLFGQMMGAALQALSSVATASIQGSQQQSAQIIGGIRGRG